MRIHKLVTGLASVLVLAACANQPEEEPRRTYPAPVGSFEYFLEENYRRLSLVERAERDFAEEERLLAKADRINEGYSVQPDRLTDREFRYPVPELGKARECLMLALQSDAPATAPEQLALSQVMFDRWMFEMEECVSSSDIRDRRR